MKKLTTILSTVLTLLVTTSVMAQGFPRLEADTLKFNYARFTDVESEVSRTTKVKFKVEIGGNYLDAIARQDTTHLNFVGPFIDVIMEGVKMTTIQTDMKEMIFMPESKDFLIFVNEKNVTRLFNKK